MADLLARGGAMAPANDGWKTVGDTTGAGAALAPEDDVALCQAAFGELLALVGLAAPLAWR